MTTSALTPSVPVPRVPGWPWSHLLRMRRDPMGLMREGASLGADVVRLSFGTIPAFVLYSPEVVHRVLVPGENVWKGTRGAKLLSRVLGPGLLTTEGVVWRERRRLAQPRFRHEALAGMPAAVQRYADRMVGEWRGAPEVDAMPALSRLALSVVCEVMFGVDPGEDAAKVHSALDEVLSGFLRIMTFPIEGIETWPLPASRRHQAAVRALDEVVGHLIERRRAAGPLEGDLLADWILAADAGRLTTEDLHAEVVTMLLAGHETTANAMSFTLALLATHPEEQRKVVAGLGPAPGVKEDLGPLERAFNEALRLYPPAWVLSRATTAPVDLGPAVAPMGSFLFIPIAAIHRDPRWWSDPDTFRPDRHLALDAAAKAAFLPFGMGPRRCVGEHFARTEARVALATVLRVFEIDADEVPAANPSVTLRPRGAVTLRLRLR